MTALSPCLVSNDRRRGNDALIIRIMSSRVTALLRIPDDLADASSGRVLRGGDLWFGEYHQRQEQQPRNIFVTEHTLIFVTKGAKVFHFPDRELTVTSGHAVLLKRGCYLLCESLQRDNEYESISIFFKATELRDFWDLLKLLHAKRKPKKTTCDSDGPLVLSVSPELAQFRESVTAMFSHQGPFVELLMRTKLQELILLLLSTSARPQVEAFFDELYDDQLPDPVYVVRKNLNKPLGLADYSKLSDRSLSKFKRDFQEQIGEAPGKWITNQRLENAHLLLKSTSLSVGEICYRSGFTNLSHFIRAYKSRYGATPASQRKITSS